MKKIFSSEVKIGAVFVVSLALLYFGLNFLKGVNIFTPSNRYFTTFQSLDGLVVSNNVMVKGYKVGQVRSITYDFSKERPFIVEVTVNDDVKLPQGSVFSMENDGIMGGKFLNLKFGASGTLIAKGDTVASDVVPGLLDGLASAVPQITAAVTKLDSVLTSVNTLVSSPELKNSLTSIEGITSDLHASSRKLNLLMNREVPSILSDVNVITTDLKQVTGDLRKTDFQALFARVDRTIANLNNFTDNLNNQNSTIGLLMKDRALYDNLNTTVDSANGLLIDLQKNPKRYVHFSLFGGKDKDKK